MSDLKINSDRILNFISRTNMEIEFFCCLFHCSRQQKWVVQNNNRDRVKRIKTLMNFSYPTSAGRDEAPTRQLL